MKEYILTLVGVSLICGIIEILFPTGNDGDMKKYVRLLASLCILCIAVFPITKLFRNISEKDINEAIGDFDIDSNMTKYDEIYKENLSRYTADEIEELCRKMICNELGMEEECFDISVYTSVNGEALSVERVVVRLYPSAVLQDPHAIRDLVYGMLECNCEIIYK